MADQYEYVAWFRDERFLPDDEDYEWPAVFLVIADSKAAAVAWGDRLSSSYAGRTTQVFLRSDATPIEGTADKSLPVVPHGVWTSDEEIGW